LVAPCAVDFQLDVCVFFEVLAWKQIATDTLAAFSRLCGHACSLGEFKFVDVCEKVCKQLHKSVVKTTLANVMVVHDTIGAMNLYMDMRCKLPNAPYHAEVLQTLHAQTMDLLMKSIFEPSKVSQVAASNNFLASCVCSHPAITVFNPIPMFLPEIKETELVMTPECKTALAKLKIQTSRDWFFCKQSGVFDSVASVCFAGVWLW
jgi:hypothetical protein